MPPRAAGEVLDHPVGIQHAVPDHRPVSRCRAAARTRGSARRARAGRRSGRAARRRPGCSASGEPSTRRAEQAGGAGDGDRRGVVPLVLPAGVHVGVGDVADHRHHLDAGRAHRDQLGVELLGQRLDERRRAGAGDRDPRPLAGCSAGTTGGWPVLKVSPSAGWATAPATRSPSVPRARRARPSRRAAARRTRGCRRAGRRSRPGRRRAATLSSLPSSESTASPGRCSASSAISSSWAAWSPASLSSRPSRPSSRTSSRRLAGGRRPARRRARGRRWRRRGRGAGVEGHGATLLATRSGRSSDAITSGPLHPRPHPGLAAMPVPRGRPPGGAAAYHPRTAPPASGAAHAPLPDTERDRPDGHPRPRGGAARPPPPQARSRLPEALPAATALRRRRARRTRPVQQFGQLGYPAPSPQLHRRPVACLTDAVEVHSGREHVVALRVNGTVMTWGNNAERTARPRRRWMIAASRPRCPG